MLTYQDHLGVTYITLNEDPCPHMLIENKCPVALLLKENAKGKAGSYILGFNDSAYSFCIVNTNFNIFYLDFTL